MLHLKLIRPLSQMDVTGLYERVSRCLETGTDAKNDTPHAAPAESPQSEEVPVETTPLLFQVRPLVISHPHTIMYW
jgi:hypothetical protein